MASKMRQRLEASSSLVANYADTTRGCWQGHTCARAVTIMTTPDNAHSCFRGLSPVGRDKMRGRSGRAACMRATTPMHEDKCMRATHA
eukprot:350559-Chlamydomonas_euryale.AAC.2